MEERAAEKEKLLSLSHEMAAVSLEKETLLNLSHDIARVRDKNDLLALINTRLKELFYFTHSSISAITPDRKHFKVFLTDPNSIAKRHPEYEKFVSTVYPVNDGVFETILESSEPTILVYKVLMDKGLMPEYARIHYEASIREAISIPLQGNKDIWGVLHFFSDRTNTFSPKDFGLIKGVANQVAIAVSNILANEELIVREREKEVLLSISYDMGRIIDKNALMSFIDTHLKKLFYFTHGAITAINPDRKTFLVYLTDPQSKSRVHPEYNDLITSVYPIDDGEYNKYLLSDEPTISDYEALVAMPNPPKYAVIQYQAGMREVVSIPLHDENEVWGVLHLYSDRKNTFNDSNINIIKGVSSQVAITVSNILAHEEVRRQLKEIEQYKEQLEKENQYLQEEIDTAYPYAEMVGSSDPMKRVYRLMSQVAASNSTVLILGETGTGKELIARAIHNTSPRKDKVMVKVNCAALPATLIESELFGHEKGSFTGAYTQRIGKFELANKSTLFLDEIGELSMELQVKLLRVLQEKEIERIGGKHSIKVDVRIITATNRNLQKEVKEGRFRSDLYYRLNVFPITLPSLRQRKEDLPLLVPHFIDRFSRNTGKKITGVSSRAMKEIMAYQWPGNIRELEHLIERLVLLAEGPVIKSTHLPLFESLETPEQQPDHGVQTLNELERDHIIRVLEQCNWKVSGIGGAAEVLQIPNTTLHSKMKKLGISKKR